MKRSFDIVDFHAHILPGADHGSDSLETSRKQFEILHRSGVSKVVATPHFYPQRDSVETFLERRESCAETLKALEGERPDIYLGAEVLVCSGIDHMPGLEKLCIKGTDVILLEMPFSKWRDEHIEAVYRISRSGLVTVMAHIDRYPLADVERLASECSLLYQINGETVKSFKGRKKADSLCRNLHIAALGSDIHGADRSAASDLVSLNMRTKKTGANIMGTARALLSGAEKL